jgi:hypothetical protein
MPTKTQTYNAHAYWRGNHWEIHLHGHGIAYLAPDDDFEHHLEQFLNMQGQHPTNPTFHLHYPQAT